MADPAMRLEAETGTGGYSMDPLTDYSAIYRSQNAEAMAMAGILSTLAGITNTAYDAYAQSRAMRLAARMEKSGARFNAKLDEIRSRQALERGRMVESEIRRKARATEATQRVRGAASNIDPRTGSMGSITSDTALFGALDAQTVANNAWREAWGYETRGGLGLIQGGWNARALKNRAQNTLATGGMQVARMAGRAAYRWDRAVPDDEGGY
jgi:hypothetical protein